VYYTYITESFLQQPSALTSLFCELIDKNTEPATQAWFKKATLCSLSHGKEKNTSESLEIQRGLRVIRILITLFLLRTLKPIMIDLLDHLHYLTYLSLSGVSTKQFAIRRLFWYGGKCIFGVNHWKQYTVCSHECYKSLFTCQSRSLCSFISKSLSTVGQGRWMHPGSLPKNLTRFAQPYVHMYSVCPFLSFTHYLFLLEEDCLQEDTALMLSSLCMSSLLTVE
jgi:hypothetical protein